ncbi:MAG: YidB family protein [Chloroflexota bacterium]
MDDRPNLPGRGGSADPMAAIGNLVAALQAEGGFDAFVGKLRAGGLGDVVDSWVSTGDNRPVEPARLANALGPDTMSRLSGSTGFSIQSLLPMLAGFPPRSSTC